MAAFGWLFRGITGAKHRGNVNSRWDVKSGTAAIFEYSNFGLFNENEHCTHHQWE